MVMSIGIHLTRAAEIAPNGVYIVAHGSSDSVTLAGRLQTKHIITLLSNGDDGYVP